MKIGIKLTITFFSIAFLAMLVIGLISYNKAKQALEEESFNKLTAVRELKADEIEEYFGEIRDQVIAFAEDPTVVEAIKEFKKGFHEQHEDHTYENKKTRLSEYLQISYLPELNNNVDKPVSLETEICNSPKGILLQYDYIVANPNPVGSKHLMISSDNGDYYSKAHARFHPYFKDFLERFSYYDIFLIDNKTGDVVYTVFKEVDFGTNLLSGPFKNTNLAEAFRHADYAQINGKAEFEDFKPYHPSYNAQASFIAAPIFENGEEVGVLAFQLPHDRINELMTSHRMWNDVGLGETGETYIVGEDLKLRSESRLYVEDSLEYFELMQKIGVPETTLQKTRNLRSTIGLQEINSKGAKMAITGESGEKIFTNYRDATVLSSFKPLKIQGMNWAIMSEIHEDEAFMHVFILRHQILISALAVVLIMLIISVFVAKQITKPIKELTNDAIELQKGNFDIEIETDRTDEIGTLAKSFRKMQQSMKKLIEELKDINHNLEQKVIDRTQEIQQQKEIVEHKNKEIVDSINYAKRLQSAILPHLNDIEKHLPDSFVLYKPKDIVAGDFYWLHAEEQKGSKKKPEIIICAADSTGHGVPGAMVSVVGANGLDRCVKEFKLTKPSDILDKLTELVVKTFEASGEDVKDGMDISLCAFDPNTLHLQWAGANNPLWIVRKDEEGIELIELKADKQPIGKFEYHKPFNNHSIQLQKGDCVYMFTDGFADQFGGELGKKFKYKTFKDLLTNLYETRMHEQLHHVDKVFMEWKHGYDQVDDVCVIGFRV